MKPLLSIMMPALHARQWQTAADVLEAQAAPYKGRVEVIVDADDGEAPSGMKRRRLVSRAAGEYLAFVDDDDEQSSDYVERLVDGCEQGPDVVTFNLAFYRDGHKRETWKLGMHGDARKLGRMTANHLCAWRAEIARKVPWCPDLGYGDDQLWYRPLRASGLVKTEHHIDHVLYRYMFSSEGTENQKDDRIAETRRYVGEGLRCFRTPRGIAIERGSDAEQNGQIECYDTSGYLWFSHHSDQPFYTARVA